MPGVIRLVEHRDYCKSPVRGASGKCDVGVRGGDRRWHSPLGDRGTFPTICAVPASYLIDRKSTGPPCQAASPTVGLPFGQLSPLPGANVHRMLTESRRSSSAGVWLKAAAEGCSDSRGTAERPRLSSEASVHRLRRTGADPAANAGREARHREAQPAEAWPVQLEMTT